MFYILSKFTNLTFFALLWYHYCAFVVNALKMGEDENATKC